MKRVRTCLKKCSRKDLASILETASRAAIEAGSVLAAFYDRPLHIRHKGEIDLVTEADLASEETIVDIFRKERPDIAVLAEESAALPEAMPEEPVWIIDPLDGTTNFAHGYPWFCVSIAFARGGKCEAGLIYSPVQDELFCACRGAGAWLNGGVIRVSDEKSLGQGLVATGFPYDVQKNPAPVLAALEAVLTRAQGVRRAGSAALDLACVAAGRLDGFWEIKLKPWDTAAGCLIVEEAGGRVTDFRGGAYSPFVPEIVATNAKLHAQIIDILTTFSERTS